MVRRLLIPLILTLPFFLGCGQNRKLFREMEGYVMEYPDSTLELLDNINPKTLRDKSYHSLFYAEALDRCYGAAGLYDTDKLSEAAEYFDIHGPSRLRLDAWYILGKNQFNSSDRSSALVSFLNAEREAAKAGDASALSKIYSYISDIYTSSSDFIQAAVFSGKSLEKLIQLKDPLLTRSGMVKYAESCRRAGLYSQADSVCWNALYYSRAAKDTLNEVRTLSCYAGSLLDEQASQDNASLAIASYSRITDQLGYSLSGEDLSYLAYAMVILSSKDFDKVLKEAYLRSDTPSERISVDRIASKIYSKAGNPAKALELIQRVQSFENQNINNKSAAISHLDFLMQQQQLQAERVRNSRLRLGAVILFLTAIMATLVLYFHAKKIQNEKIIAEEKAETEKYISIAEDLQSRIAEIQSKTSSRQPSDTSYKMSGLDALERLCEQYYIYEGTPNLQPRVLKEVRSIVEGLRTDDAVKANLEKSLDDSRDGVMRRLRAAFPKWKEEDFTLYAFTASGFSPTTVSTLMEKDKAYIYNRVYRLKGRISASENPDKKFFLDVLVNN